MAANFYALGVTVQLTPMDSEHMDEWTFITDYLKGVGPVRGYVATHPERGELGLILTKGRHCHAEWLAPQAGEYLYAGEGRTIRYALAAILRAFERDGHPLPTDTVAPAIEKNAETEADHAKLRNNVDSKGLNWALYTGSTLPELRNNLLIAFPCGEDRSEGPCSCGGYELFLHTGKDAARHVRAQHLEPTVARPSWYM